MIFCVFGNYAKPESNQTANEPSNQTATIKRNYTPRNLQKWFEAILSFRFFFCFYFIHLLRATFCVQFNLKKPK